MTAVAGRDAWCGDEQADRRMRVVLVGARRGIRPCQVSPPTAGPFHEWKDRCSRTRAEDAQARVRLPDPAVLAGAQTAGGCCACR